jgi:hypothetical protein
VVGITLKYAGENCIDSGDHHSHEKGLFDTKLVQSAQNRLERRRFTEVLQVHIQVELFADYTQKVDLRKRVPIAELSSVYSLNLFGGKSGEYEGEAIK